MNLNSFIAKSGFCSRRKADVHIKQGRVEVNKKVIREPWYALKGGETVTVAGKSLSPEQTSYLIVNKPKGVTVTLDDKFASRKIADMIPKRYGRLYPVGRLDKDSRGLLILTNDGDLCYRLTHPKFKVEKEYIALVKGDVDKEALKKLRKGIHDGGELLRVKSCAVSGSDNGKTELNIVISEGKKRHIRRLLKQLGFSVLDLKRVRIGNLRLGELREGSFRDIDKETVYRLALGSS